MKKTTMIRWILFFALVSLIFVIRYSGITDRFTIADFKMSRQWFENYVTYHYKVAVLEYILLYIVAVSLSLPVAAFLTIAGGYLFGTIPATIYANIGATIGSIIAFLLIRYLIGKDVQANYKEQLLYFNTMVHKHGVSFLLFTRLIAVVPLFLITILAAISKVSFFNFLWTTSLGMVPGALVYAFAGRQLHKIETIRDVFSPGILFAFLLLGLLALMPVLVKRFRKS